MLIHCAVPILIIDTQLEPSNDEKQISMANPINQTVFLKRFLSDTESIHIGDMDPKLRQTLKQHNIDNNALKIVAGEDGIIKNKQEIKHLLSLSKNKSTKSKQNIKLYRALLDELDRKKKESQYQSILHLGMREESIHEVTMLEQISNVHRIETKHKQTSVQELVEQENMSLDKAKAFIDFLSEQTILNPKNASILYHVGLNLHDIEQGKIKANRLILSGHSGGATLFGNDSAHWITFKNINNIASLFPEGAKHIKHIAVSACHSGYEDTLALFRQAFPNLKTYYGYTGPSPTAETSSPKHLKRWAQMTAHHKDPSVLDPFFTHVSTWNTIDGFHGPIVGKTWEELNQSVLTTQYAYNRYYNGERNIIVGTRDSELNWHYIHLTRLLHHPDLPQDKYNSLYDYHKEVLALRLALSNH